MASSATSDTNSTSKKCLAEAAFGFVEEMVSCGCKDEETYFGSQPKAQ